MKKKARISPAMEIHGYEEDAEPRSKLTIAVLIILFLFWAGVITYIFYWFHRRA
jgi:hypothetical protein